jgi:hypothetical protein
MANVPFFFKSPDDPKLDAILVWYEQGNLQEALPERTEMERWSDEVSEALAEKAGEFYHNRRVR